MSCERWTDAISALADGEPAGVDPALVEAHLSVCEPCRRFADEAHRLGRVGLVTSAPEVADLSREVARATARADPARHAGLVRGLLLAVALVIIGLSVPPLLGGGATGSASHDARHVGAFAVAYAVGLIVVAIRPARARTMLPVAGVLTLALAITAVFDVSEGTIPLLHEVVHVPELASVALVWALATPGRTPDPMGGVGDLEDADGVRLRVVRDPADHGRRTG